MATRIPLVANRCSALLLVAFALAACGGTDHGRPSAQVVLDAGADPNADCSVTAGLTLQRITDFEPPPGANPNLKPTATCDAVVDSTKSACMYYNFDIEQSPKLCGSRLPSLPSCNDVNGAHAPDSFCMTSNLPSAGQNVAVTPISGGRCGVSSFAFHLAATNLSTCYDPTTKKEGWGVTLQITFNPSPNNAGISQQLFDASLWDGVSLWERRGTGPSGGAILVSIQDQYSASGSGTPGFQCSAFASPEPAIPGMPSPPDAEKCDAFGLGVGLTSDWQFVKIPFADAKQKGFGLPSPLGHLDTSALAGMQLGFSPGDWDVWIDDLAFYREP